MSSDDRTTEIPQPDRADDHRTTAEEAASARTTPQETVAHEPRTHESRTDAPLAEERWDHEPETAPVAVPHDRREVVAAEREQFGGVKLGSAFFGWLTAMGTGVLLTALLAAAGTAVRLSDGTTATEAAADAVDDPASVGIIGAVLLGLVVLVAYYCGGYVAGRMARFDGGRQGVAVWLWAVIAAVVVAVLGVVAGDRYNVLDRLDAFPRVPVGEGDLTTVGLLAAVVVLLTSLLGSVLGGLAGMRFHRRVDRAGLGD